MTPPTLIESELLFKCPDERRWRNLRPDKFASLFEAEVAGPWNEEPVAERLEVDLPSYGLCSLRVLTTGLVILTNAKGRMSLFETAERVAARDSVRAWSEFSRGHWSRATPAEPGLYIVTDLEYGRQSVRELVFVDGKLRDSTGFVPLGQVSTWGGYWYLPRLPRIGHSK